MNWISLGFLLLIGLVHIQSESVNRPARARRQFNDWWTFPNPWWSFGQTTRPGSTQRPPVSSNGSAIGCGVQAPNFQPDLRKKDSKIINGQEAKPHSWPWVIAFLGNISGRERVMCGGSLIRVKQGVEETDIVLTAAHCVTRMETIEFMPQPVSASSLTVAAGRHRYNAPDSYDQKRRGQKITIHPRFGVKDDTIVNDIALVKLASSIKFNDAIRPICLPEQGAAIPTGQTCVAAGWGRNNSLNQFLSPEALQQLVLPVHSAQTCTRGWQNEYKQESMICAGDLNGNSGVCNGDSGSTLMCKQNGKWIQYGVVSFGVPGDCLEANMPDVYTRISYYADWIKQSMQQMTSL